MVSSRSDIKVTLHPPQLHKHSEVRFDIVTPTVTWYLRAHTPVDRDTWTGIIAKHRVSFVFPVIFGAFVIVLSMRNATNDFASCLESWNSKFAFTF